MPLAAYIPPDYLPDEAERLKVYKELMSADRAQTQAILMRLAQQCGPAPEELSHLVEIISLANQAGALGIYALDWMDPALEFQFTKQTHLPEQLPEKLFAQYGADNVQFLQSKNGYGLRINCPAKTRPLAFAQEALLFFHRLLSTQK